jgi:hypothetical protein
MKTLSFSTENKVPEEPADLKKNLGVVETH